MLEINIEIFTKGFLFLL